MSGVISSARAISASCLTLADLAADDCGQAALRQRRGPVALAGLADDLHLTAEPEGPDPGEDLDPEVALRRVRLAPLLVCCAGGLPSSASSDAQGIIHRPFSPRSPARRPR